MSKEPIPVGENWQFGLMLSLLSRKQIVMSELPCASADKSPDFVKLLAPKSSWQVSKNSYIFTPGLLEGGKIKFNSNMIPHTIGFVLALSPFLGNDLELEMHGPTNHYDNSTDLYKIFYYKIFSLFNLPKFELKVKKRAFTPSTEGIITLKTKCVKQISPIDIQEMEPIEKIRGFIITARIGSDIARRMTTTIKKEMADLCNNVKVLCVSSNRNDSTPSPGYECSILGESRHGVIFETVNNNEIPEKMANQCCVGFLKRVETNCIFDERLTLDIVLLMGLAEGVSHLIISRSNTKVKICLRMMKTFLNVNHKIEKYEKDENLEILTVFGCGYRNPFIPM